MIDINVPNVLTIGLIAVGTFALLKFGSKATGIQLPSWLG